MPQDGYQIPGGSTPLTNDPVKGVYARSPAFSPKYHTGGGPESILQQARMWIQFPNQAAHEAFVATLASDRAKDLGKVLGVAGTKIEGGARGELGGLGYIDFILSGAGIQYSELHSVSESLSDVSVVYAFGQQTPRMSLNGLVYNTRQDNWLDALTILYQDIIRATQLADRRLTLMLQVDSQLHFCVPVGMSMQLSAEREMVAQFSMSLLVRRTVILDSIFYHNRPTSLREISEQNPELRQSIGSRNMVLQDLDAGLTATLQEQNLSSSLTARLYEQALKKDIDPGTVKGASDSAISRVVDLLSGKGTTSGVATPLDQRRATEEALADKTLTPEIPFSSATPKKFYR